MSAAAARPVAVQINYHRDALVRMKALLARYFDEQPAELQMLPLADMGPEATPGAAPSCERDEGVAEPAEATLGATLVEKSPYAWAGIGDMHFKGDGTLETPWGAGRWGGLGAEHPRGIFADFVGSKHNVEFLPSGLGVSTRCRSAARDRAHRQTVAALPAY